MASTAMSFASENSSRGREKSNAQKLFESQYLSRRSTWNDLTICVRRGEWSWRMVGVFWRLYVKMTKIGLVKPVHHAIDNTR